MLLAGNLKAFDITTQSYQADAQKVSAQIKLGALTTSVYINPLNAKEIAKRLRLAGFKVTVSYLHNLSNEEITNKALYNTKPSEIPNEANLIISRPIVD